MALSVRTFARGSDSYPIYRNHPQVKEFDGIGGRIGYADDFTEENINYLVRHCYQPVYNIEVRRPYHTYHVGTQGYG
ncbi:MAG: hypothetical protein IPM78_13415 [Moraxellaceae bacterium]|nr:hypothetical protein [Moraxellaceae bacterium]